MNCMSLMRDETVVRYQLWISAENMAGVLLCASGLTRKIASTSWIIMVLAFLVKTDSIRFVYVSMHLPDNVF